MAQNAKIVKFAGISAADRVVLAAAHGVAA
jgi:hypothetical protein